MEKPRRFRSDPDDNADDVVEFLDGRAIQRHYEPWRIRGRVAGRVCGFREITVQRLDRLRTAARSGGARSAYAPAGGGGRAGTTGAGGNQARRGDVGSPSHRSRKPWEPSMPASWSLWMGANGSPWELAPGGERGLWAASS
jgi:hypothetical protein